MTPFQSHIIAETSCDPVSFINRILALTSDTNRVKLIKVCQCYVARLAGY